MGKGTAKTRAPAKSLRNRPLQNKRIKVLLTGGAGYIGSHTTVELYASGHTAVIVDSLVNSSRKAIKAVEKITGAKIPFYKTDCRNYKQLKTIFDTERPDAVIHFAGYKAVGESVEQPHKYWDNNINSTLNLIEVMDESGCKNIIFSSTATVYGESAPVPYTETTPAGIDLAHPYAETKYTIERILQNTFTADPAWNITILRYFNPVGAHPSGLIGEDPKGIPNNLMPYITQVAVGKLPHLNIYGNDYPTRDGTGVRDYIHVIDLARGHIAALDNDSPALRTYNLGTGAGVSVLELLRAYETAAKMSVPHKFAARRPGDLPAFWANPEKANHELTWCALHSTHDACAHSHNWQSKNPNGY